jgi:hypothetical protein
MRKNKPTDLPILSLGDILDRITILIRKVFRGEEDAYKELEYLKNGLNNLGYNGDIILASLRLAHMNWAIWDLENQIRRLGDPVAKLGLEEIGKRAMKIRDYNKKRINYKNDLNRLSGSSFVEFKTEHRAQ